jgi:hypothetical protein
MANYTAVDSIFHVLERFRCLHHCFFFFVFFIAFARIPGEIVLLEHVLL